MKQEIKERIEQINNGIVPEGYNRVKYVGIVPSEWTVGCIEDVVKQVLRPIPKPNAPYWRLGVRSWARGTFHSFVDEPSSVNMDELYIVHKDDLVLNITFAWEHAIALAKPQDNGMLVSHRFPTYTFINGNVPKYFENLFSQGFYRYMLESVSPGGAGRNRVLDKNAFLKLPCIIPPIYEQAKIAEILSAQDKVIELKEKLILYKKSHRLSVIKKLISEKNDLTENGNRYSFSQAFISISTKSHQIPKSEYDNNGAFPVIDQGKKKIVSYSNNKSKVYNCPEQGIIVFGDHTREIKYVDFDFVVGADGTKLLCSSKPGIKTKYLYYFLLSKRIVSNGYSRHFNIIKNFSYYVPSLEKQVYITNVLSVFDKEIELLEHELEQEKQKKKALMQLLLTGIVRVKND